MRCGSGARLEKFKGEDLKLYDDSAKLIRSGEVDAVIIATPHYAHTTVGIDAFENGVHVLVEKPISVHKADCERLIAAYKKSKDLKFSAMFQMRTRPVWKKIKALIDSGELGEIVRTNWIITGWFRSQSYYDSGGWRATWKGEGGGVLLNQCPHNLDLFQWLCGLPVRVQAFCGFGKYHDIETEDDVTAYFEYANGATGVFIASTGEAPGSERLEIAGDRGKIVLEDGKIKFTRTEVSVKEFTKTDPGRFRRPEVWNIDVPFPDEKSGHYMITQNFVNAILDGEPLIAPAEEGIHSVEFANAMLYSAWTGKPCDVPIDAAAYAEKLSELAAGSKFEKTVKKSTEDDFAKSFR